MSIFLPVNCSRSLNLAAQLDEFQHLWIISLLAAGRK